MPTEALQQLIGGAGVGEKAVHHATVNAADGDTYDTGLSSIDHAVAEAENNNAGTTLNQDSIASTSGGTVTFDCATVDSTSGGSANTTAHDITVIAIGDA